MNRNLGLILAFFSVVILEPVCLARTNEMEITGLHPFYSAPYLIDYSFIIRDPDDHAVKPDPSKVLLRCYETDDRGTQPISATETGARFMAANKQMQGFLVLDYTRSMLDPQMNGDADGDGVSDSAVAMQEGAKGILGALPWYARVGLYEFHRADAGFPPQKITEMVRDKSYLTNQIDALWSKVAWSSGASRCWDALYLALQEFPAANPWDEQRFLVFLSDGQDESSTHGPTNVVELAKSKNVLISCIGYGSELNPEPLQLVTTETGGRYYEAARPADLPKQFREVAQDLSSRYLVRWASLKRRENVVTNTFWISYSGSTAGVTNIPAPFYPLQHQGDELRGKLLLDSSAEPNDVTSVIFRASYVPRGVTRIRVNFATTNNLLRVERIPFAQGGLCPDDWAFTVNQSDGVGYFEFSSRSPGNVFDALPVASLGMLVEFRFQGVADAKNCFDDLKVDNSVYSQPGGPSFYLENNGPVSPNGDEQPPVITEFNILTSGESVSFIVKAEGGGLNYQWYCEGEPIAGANGNILTYTNASATANAGYYSVVVSNTVGTATTPPPGLMFMKSVESGTYYGVFCDEENTQPESTGTFNFTLSSSKRTYTGKVTRGTATYKFSGSFNPSHSSVSRTLVGKDGTGLTMQLRLLTTNGSWSVIGTASDGNWTVPLKGVRANYTAKVPSSIQGKYTLSLRNVTLMRPGTAPHGSGCAAVTVSPQGRLRLTGWAADGTAISASSYLSRSDYSPLYIPLYKGQGCLVGWLSFGGTNDLGWETYMASLPDVLTNSFSGGALDSSLSGGPVRWVKNSAGGTTYPDGFSTVLAPIGSKFSATGNLLPFDKAVAVLTLGDLFAEDLATWNFTQVTIGQANQLRCEPGPEKLKLSVQAQNGFIKGSFIHPDTKLSTAVKGILLQEQGYGVGYFLSSHASGYFGLEPGQ